MLTDLRFVGTTWPLAARVDDGRCKGAITRTSGLGDASLSGLPTPVNSSVLPANVDDLQ